MAKVKLLDKIQNLADELIEDGVERNKILDKSDKMWKVDWSVPDSLKGKDWIVPAPTSDPRDQMLSGGSMLANNKETRHFNPYDDTPEAKNLADRVEKNLAWTFHQATRRRHTSIVQDMIMSGIRHGAICYENVFLPYQAKIFGMSAKRKRAIARFGNTSYVVHNIKTVYPRYSDYMLENILVVHTMDYNAALDFFGERMEKLDNAPDEITIYDWWDLDNRAVWYSSEGSAIGGTAILDPDGKDGKHGLPFIPWVCRIGGSTLDDDAEDQYNPLCLATIRNNSWKVQNLVRTLVLSEGIAHMSSPKWGKFGPGAEEVTIDYGDPAVNITSPNAETKVEAFNAVPMDQGLMNMVNIFRADMDKSSLSPLMQGGSMPSGTAYATYNIKMQSDMSRLFPYKALAQEAIAEGDVITMQWYKHMRMDFVGYGMGKNDRNKKYTVEPQEYDMDKIHIDVELNPDIPVDRNQRINGAINLYERLGVSLEEVLDELGYENPSDIAKQSAREKIIRAMWDAKAKEILSAVDVKVQAQMAQIQMGIQQQAQQQQMMQQAQMQQSQGPTPQQMPQPGAPQGLPEQAGGFNNNPAEGAPSPQEGFPFGTMEQQTGMSRGGEEGFEP
jgi:hypothetical protein